MFNPEMIAMRQVFLNRLREHPVRKDQTFFGFGIWMANHLDDLHFSMLDAIEEAVGEEEANAWLISVLVESGQFKDSGDGDVIAVGL